MRCDMASIQLASSKLMLMAGGTQVDVLDVRSAHTPPPTDTHFPIPHSRVLDEVVSTLDDLGWQVQNQAHALMGDGMRYFALLQLATSAKLENLYGAPDKNSSWMIGIRNAHDKSFTAEGMLGTHLSICDNMMFTGRSGSVFHFARKHTRFIERDFSGLVAKAFGTLASAMTAERDRIAAYKAFAIESDVVVHDFIIRALKKRAITSQMLPLVLTEWNRANGAGGFSERAVEMQDYSFVEPTAWKLQQCFTEVEKEKHSLLATPNRNSRLAGLLDGLVGLSSVSDSAE